MRLSRRWMIWGSLLGLSMLATLWVERSDNDVTVVESVRTHEVLNITPRANEKISDELAALERRLASRRHSGIYSEGTDPFATISWQPPAAPPVLAPIVEEPPPVPTAPPLPFRYLGVLKDGQKHWLVQLARGNQYFVAGKGDAVGDDYRLDGFENGQLVFTYLPLVLQQFLPIVPES